MLKVSVCIGYFNLFTIDTKTKQNKTKHHHYCLDKKILCTLSEPAYRANYRIFTFSEI